MAVAACGRPRHVLSEYGNRDAVVLYAATIVAASSLLMLLWLHLGRHRDWLVQGPTLAAGLRRERQRTLMVPAVFLLSMPLAWLDPAWAMYSWLLLLPAALVVGRP